MINSLSNSHPVAAEKFGSSLLESKGFVFLDLLEVRRTNPSPFVFEEEPIGFLNALADILHGLRADLLPPLNPLAAFGDMLLELGTVQVLAPHPVVPFVERNTVVVDTSCGVNCPLEVSVPLVAVELELERFHSTDYGMAVGKDKPSTCNENKLPTLQSCAWTGYSSFSLDTLPSQASVLSQ